MARSLMSYVFAAFNAKPWGMPVAPNWVALAGFAMAGVINPGFWAIGAGVELGYLLTLATNKRFMRVVDAAGRVEVSDSSRITRMLAGLLSEDTGRYNRLMQRCREILREQASHGADISAQNEGLSRLMLLYLQLLVTRQDISRVLGEGNERKPGKEGQGEQEGGELATRAEELQRQLKNQEIGPELRNSLEGQLEILRQRLAARQEAAQKLDFVNAELVRIQEQVELVREQAALSTDPASLAQRIDSIAGSLTQTGQWIRDQQSILGKLDDITTEPPSLVDTENMQSQ